MPSTPKVTPRTNYPYMVWSKGRGRPPRARFETLKEAETEAERLALAKPGTRYTIFQEIGSTHVPVSDRKFGQYQPEA